MFKKSIKYLVISFVNLIILTIMLAYWTDKVELTFNNFVRPIEFLKIIGFTILSLIIISISIPIYSKYRINSIKKRVVISSIITILISSYLYINYSSKIIQNRFVNNEIRLGVSKKIKSLNKLSFGTKSEKLTNEEYNEITNINWFPKLTKSAKNISYSYTYDGFLPDYSFTLNYDLPKNINVDTINVKDGNFSKSCQFKIIGNTKRVEYYESQW